MSFSHNFFLTPVNHYFLYQLELLHTCIEDERGHIFSSRSAQICGDWFLAVLHVYMHDDFLSCCVVFVLPYTTPCSLISCLCVLVFCFSCGCKYSIFLCPCVLFESVYFVEEYFVEECIFFSLQVPFVNLYFNSASVINCIYINRFEIYLSCLSETVPFLKNQKRDVSTTYAQKIRDI